MKPKTYLGDEYSDLPSKEELEEYAKLLQECINRKNSYVIGCPRKIEEEKDSNYSTGDEKC